MARTDPQFNIRVPQELKEQIEKSAKENGRSVTQEVVQVLGEYYFSKFEPISLTKAELQKLADIVDSLSNKQISD